MVLHLEASAVDDALDLFSVLMKVKLISAARRATDRDWLAAWLRRAHRQTARKPAYSPDSPPQRYDIYEAEQLVDLAMAHEPEDFLPGKGWAYLPATSCST
ncbi:hypothetical protein ACWELO_36030 [Streptomyces sp. NPDC004596]